MPADWQTAVIDMSKIEQCKKKQIYKYAIHCGWFSRTMTCNLLGPQMGMHFSASSVISHTP